MKDPDSSSLVVRNALTVAVAKGSRILLAVSGGLDSMCLLRSCTALPADYFEKLSVFHLDHQIRLDSASDAEFVSNECRRLDLELHLEKLPPLPNGENFEAWARQQRYQRIQSILAGSGYDFCLTAHHADDVAETFIMRMLSNKDLRGILATDKQRRLIRPFLSITRKNLQEYASEQQVEFREDQSNQDTSYLRNAVRHKLLPYIREVFTSDPTEYLGERAQDLAEALNGISEVLQGRVDELAPLEFGSREWFRAVQQVLEELPAGFRWRFLEVVFHDKLRFNIGLSAGKRLLAVFERRATGVSLPGGYLVSCKDSGITLTCPTIYPGTTKK